MGLTPRDHTKATLAKMQIAASTPGNLDRNKDANSDDFGRTSAGSSDSSSFAFGGRAAAPHMGRPGRQAGGRITGQLHRTRRTPDETESDIASEDKAIQSLAKDRGTTPVKDMTLQKRIGRQIGGRFTGTDAVGIPMASVAGMESRPGANLASPARRFGVTRPESRALENQLGPNLVSNPSDYRASRARGGRTKGKTTVNVIIGGDRDRPQTPPMPPPPMAAPPPPPPPPPPRPMPPPAGAMPMAPPGGAPMGAAGAPPPGVPPQLRARGGRIGRQDGGSAPGPNLALFEGAAEAQRDAQRASGGRVGKPTTKRIEIASAGHHSFGKGGTHAFGKGGTKSGLALKETSGAGGLGRIEKAERQK